MKRSRAHTLNKWIFHSYRVTPGGLALYRIFCAVFILLFLLPSPAVYTALGSMPSDFFAPPPGPMMIFDGFPPAALLLGLHYALTGALVLTALGLKTQWMCLLSGVLLLVLKGFTYSLGKINHDLLLAVVPLVMAFSGWGQAYSLDALRGAEMKQEVRGWPLALMALIIGFMMFTAGLPKILGGWLDPATHATQGHYLKQFMVRGRQDLLAAQAHLLPGVVWELFDYGTVLFEVGFLWAAFRAGRTRLFIALAVVFHSGTMLLMNIVFLPNFVAYAAFLNWSWVDRKTGGTHSRMLTSAIWVLPLLLGAVYLLGRILDPWMLNHSDLQAAHVMLVLAALPLALYYLGRRLWRSISPKRKTNPKAQPPA